MSKSLERLHFEREWDELIIELRFRDFGDRGAACLFGEGCVWGGCCCWFLFLLYSSGTLKILDGVTLHTRTRSAKRLQYLKQILGESESIRSQCNDGLVVLQLQKEQNFQCLSFSL